MFLPLLRRVNAAIALAFPALLLLIGLTGTAAASAPHGMSLSQAPAGLRAAVRRTLGPQLALSSAFQQGKLTASDGAAGDYFGYSVAISGSTAVVGAYVKNSNTGAAYVYIRSGTTWSPQQELKASDAHTGDDFGNSVAISGSTIVVGAPCHDPCTGAAYVFVRSGTTWSQQQELTAGRGGQFGASVAVYGSTAVIGAPLASAAYVYFRSGATWSQQAALTPSTGGGEFGYSVALSGSTAAVGAPFQNSSTGAAYVFVQSGSAWPQQAKLTASDAATGDEFGWSIGVSGSTAVVGAPNKSSDKGEAYVFVRSGAAWPQQAKLTASGGAAGDFYGTSVATNGLVAVVGAPGNSGTGAAYVYTQSGTAWPGLSKLTASDAAAGDSFGHSVAISGATAIIGAPGKSSQRGAAYMFVLPSQTELRTDGAFGTSVAISGSTAIVGAPNNENARPGAAYVFVHSGTTWTQQAKLAPSDSANDDFFGWSVALSGSTALVGAIGQGSQAGAAYVFVSSGGKWSQQQKLTASDAAPNDHFGYSVGLNGSTAVIGAPNQGSKGAQAGATYVFVGSGGTWAQHQKLTASDAAPGDFFGYSVAIYGSTAIVGAAGKSSNTGAAYVFVSSGGTWSQHQKLTASDGVPGDAFGNSVALNGSTAVIGAPKNSGKGAAYVFISSAGTWTQRAKLTAADAAANDWFGFSVAIYGSTAVVGAIDKNSGTGAAYVFVPTPSAPQSWSQQQKLTASDGGPQDGFGYSVALYGTTALIGALGHDSDTGAVYVFNQSGSTWSQTGELTAVSAFGASVAIYGSTAVVGAPDSNSDTGTAYVFVSNGTGWSVQAQLTASDATAHAFFGGSVAIYGSTVVIGASNASSERGAAYVFVRSGTTWTQQAELIASDAAYFDGFGTSVAISGSTAVIGAPDKFSNSGAAYVFTQSGSAWSQQAQLTDGAANAFFGYSVAIDGSTAVIGAYGENSYTGAVYVFTRSGSTWSQQAKLPPPATGESFGISVAMSGSTALVGASGTASSPGAAYVFTRSGVTWSQQAKLTAADAAAGDAFGWSVGVSGSTAIVGAYAKNSQTGAAYVFVRSGSVWPQAAKLTASDAATGDKFGSAVAIYGSTAIVGAWDKGSATGASYVFANV